MKASTSQHEAATTTTAAAQCGPAHQVLLRAQEPDALPTLPKEVLTALLQYVPLAHRLSSCALVSHTWCTAATASCIELDVGVKAAQCQPLEQWLGKHGSQVTSLQLHFVHGITQTQNILKLPYQQLQQLKQLTAKGVSLHTSSPAAAQATSDGNSGTAPSTLALLTSLTELQLNNCIVTGVSPSTLSALTNLQRLQLRNATWNNTAANSAASSLDATYGNKADILAAFLAIALPALTAQLTHLKLESGYLTYGTGWQVNDAAAAAVSSLQHLQHLVLASSGITGASLASMPLSLTSLEVPGGPGMIFSSRSTPRLCQLTGLQQLVINSAELLDPHLLAHLPAQLTHLNLFNCELAVGAAASCGTAVLLAQLPRLTHLKHLGLGATLMDLATSLQPYAALTSSSHLTRLDLRLCKLPAGAMQHIFAAGRQLSALKQLAVPAGPGDVGPFAACCCALQQLHLDSNEGAARLGMDQLTALQRLTRLEVTGAAADDNVARNVLVQLTGLIGLRIKDAPSFTDAGMLH